jgi:hypothetical protein
MLFTLFLSPLHVPEPGLGDFNILLGRLLALLRKAVQYMNLAGDDLHIDRPVWIAVVGHPDFADALPSRLDRLLVPRLKADLNPPQDVAEIVFHRFRPAFQCLEARSLDPLTKRAGAW